MHISMTHSRIRVKSDYLIGLLERRVDAPHPELLAGSVLVRVALPRPLIR